MADFEFADAHCHLEQCSGAILPTILHITCGYSHETNARNAKIAEDNGNVYLCAGIAPQEAMRHKDVKIKLVEWEESIASLPKLVAIGEIGLDYHWAKTEEEKYLQQECFLSQLQLAERLSLPVVIHSRDAEEKCLEILRNFNLPFLMHCYSGSVETGLLAIGGKGMISIPPIHNKERKRLIRDAPLDKLVAETDAPYIGKTPSDAWESIKMIAEIKGVEEKQVAQETLRNTASFFRIV